MIKVAIHQITGKMHIYHEGERAICGALVTSKERLNGEDVKVLPPNRLIKLDSITISLNEFMEESCICEKCKGLLDHRVKTDKQFLKWVHENFKDGFQPYTLPVDVKYIQGGDWRKIWGKK